MLASSAAVCLSPPTKNAAGQKITTLQRLPARHSFAACLVRQTTWQLEWRSLALRTLTAGMCKTGRLRAIRMTEQYPQPMTRNHLARRLAPRFQPSHLMIFPDRPTLNRNRRARARDEGRAYNERWIGTSKPLTRRDTGAAFASAIAHVADRISAELQP
jgi:hypothetical protein